MSRWIPVKTRLPKVGVLVVCTGFIRDVGMVEVKVTNRRWYAIAHITEFKSWKPETHGDQTIDTLWPATHWMPLPKL